MQLKTRKCVMLHRPHNIKGVCPSFAKYATCGALCGLHGDKPECVYYILKWSYAIVYDHRLFKLYVPHRGAKKQQQFIQYSNRNMSDHIEMLRPPYQYFGNDTFQIAYTHICSLQLIIPNREGCHQAYRHSHTSTCSFPFAFSVFDLIYWPYTSIHKPLNLRSISIPCPCLVWGLLKSNMVLK